MSLSSPTLSTPKVSERFVPDSGTPAAAGPLVKAGLVIATLLICLLSLEAALRIMHRYPMDNSQGYFQEGGVSYVLKKNVKKEVVWPTVSFKVCTSEQGFRWKQTGPHPVGEKPYYVTLGSSDAFGNGLDYDKTFVGIVGDKLLQKDGVDMFNLAVAGHHLDEQIALFKQFASSTTNHPEAVMVVFNPLFIGGFDNIHKDCFVKRGDLFEKDGWRIAFTRKFLANTSAAYCFFRDGIRHLQQRYFERKDFELSFYIDRFSTHHRIHARETQAEFLQHINDLDNVIRGINAKPVFVYCPPVGVFVLNDLAAKGKVDPSLFDTRFFSDVVEGYCKDKGIDFINLEPLLEERYKKGEKLNFDADAHFNGPTSRLVGEALFNAVESARKR